MKVICVCMYIYVHACLQVLYSFGFMYLCHTACLLCMCTYSTYVCVLLLLVHIHVILFPFLCRFEFEKLVLALSTTRESAAKHISEHLSLLQTSDFSTPSAPDHQLHTFGSVILGCYVSEMGKVMGVCTYVFVDIGVYVFVDMNTYRYILLLGNLVTVVIMSCLLQSDVPPHLVHKVGVTLSCLVVMVWLAMTCSTLAFNTIVDLPFRFFIGRKPLEQTAVY